MAVQQHLQLLQTKYLANRTSSSVKRKFIPRVPLRRRELGLLPGRQLFSVPVPVRLLRVPGLALFRVAHPSAVTRALQPRDLVLSDLLGFPFS